MKNHLAAVSRNKIAATITNNSIAQVFQSQARRVGLNVIIYYYKQTTSAASVAALGRFQSMSPGLVVLIQIWALTFQYCSLSVAG